ncbi:MAG: 2-amino-4-hydroxy-6-hydroxymethyldihydropteridine pyrophosphokinae [Polaromonas sp.]|nr:2-amino-4-hydroxy-6-hydroxymethyldihydropteridine pyrophosphokinae [Polaromonas sp.]
MVGAYIALGANLGDAPAAIRSAVNAIAGLPQTRVVKTSGLYKTAPLVPMGDAPDATQPSDPGGDYLNAVVEVQTALTAPALLHSLQHIEQAAGRQRPYPNAPRTLDLDLLLYGSASIESARLVVPHPRMWQRAFVLVPLAEIAPGLVGPSQLKAVEDQRIEMLSGL